MELNNQNTVMEDSGSRKNEIPMNQRYTLSLNLVEVRYVSFPQHELFATVGGNRLMVHRSAVPAIAQRIKALEEVSAETDCVLNFDLDTLFLGSAVPLLEEITAEHKSGIFGVSERENRDRMDEADEA